MLNLLFLTDKTTGPGTEAAAAAAGGKSTSGDRPRSAPSLDGVPSRKWRERPVLYKDGDRRCLSERGVGKQPVGLILSLSLSLSEANVLLRGRRCRRWATRVVPRRFGKFHIRRGNVTKFQESSGNLQKKKLTEYGFKKKRGFPSHWKHERGGGLVRAKGGRRNKNCGRREGDRGIPATLMRRNSSEFLDVALGTRSTGLWRTESVDERTKRREEKGRGVEGRKFTGLRRMAVVPFRRGGDRRRFPFFLRGLRWAPGRWAARRQATLGERIHLEREEGWGLGVG